jgi:hypothetical protein
LLRLTYLKLRKKMFKYILIAILCFILGVFAMYLFNPNKVEIKHINHTITDTLIQKVEIMQKAKEVIKLVHYTKLKREVDTLHTIDTAASELVFKLLSEINKRDSIIAIDSMQVDALIKISDIQTAQIDTLEIKLTEASKPKKALKYSLLANLVLLLGFIMK